MRELESVHFRLDNIVSFEMAEFPAVSAPTFLEGDYQAPDRYRYDGSLGPMLGTSFRNPYHRHRPAYVRRRRNCNGRGGVTLSTVQLEFVGGGAVVSRRRGCRPETFGRRRYDGQGDRGRKRLPPERAAERGSPQERAGKRLRKPVSVRLPSRRRAGQPVPKAPRRCWTPRATPKYGSALTTTW